MFPFVPRWLLLAAFICAGIWAPLASGSDIDPQVIAAKIAESSGGNPTDYLEYAESLAKTMSTFDATQLRTALGDENYVEVTGDGGDSSGESSEGDNSGNNGVRDHGAGEGRGKGKGKGNSNNGDDDDDGGDGNETGGSGNTTPPTAQDYAQALAQYTAAYTELTGAEAVYNSAQAAHQTALQADPQDPDLVASTLASLNEATSTYNQHQATAQQLWDQLNEIAAAMNSGDGGDDDDDDDDDDGDD